MKLPSFHQPSDKVSFIVHYGKLSNGSTYLSAIVSAVNFDAANGKVLYDLCLEDDLGALHLDSIPSERVVQPVTGETDPKSH